MVNKDLWFYFSLLVQLQYLYLEFRMYINMWLSWLKVYFVREAPEKQQH